MQRHARDSVRAMWLMLQMDKPNDYVIATGQQYSVKDFITLAFSKVNIELEWKKEHNNIYEYAVNKSNNQIIVRMSDEYFRKNELYDMVGDSSLIYNNLGWKPEISFDELVNEMINHDLNNILKF